MPVSLAERLRELIQREGSITFHDWMKAALYDPDGGYYQRADRTRWGRAGDYRTSPERSELFAATFARYFVNTMTIEIVVVIGTVLTCSIAAFSFARLRWRGRNIAFAILLSSVMLPYAVTLIPTFVMWRSLAEAGHKMLRKGKLVYVEGKARTRTFEDKDGVKRYTTEVIPDNFTLLGRNSDFETDESSSSPTGSTVRHRESGSSGH